VNTVNHDMISTDRYIYRRPVAAPGRQDRQVTAGHPESRQVSLVCGHSAYAIDDHSGLANSILQASKLKL